MCEEAHFTTNNIIKTYMYYFSSALILSIVTLPSIWTPYLRTRNAIAPTRSIETIRTKRTAIRLKNILASYWLASKSYAETSQKRFSDYIRFARNYGKRFSARRRFPNDGNDSTFQQQKNLLGTIIGVGRNTFI